MVKNCLTCEYEPEWGKWIGGDFPRRSGKCKWELPVEPAECYTCYKQNIIRHNDDSGIHYNCPQWKPKK